MRRNGQTSGRPEEKLAQFFQEMHMQLEKHKDEKIDKADKGDKGN